jgi:hypothetical protein
MAPSKRTQSKTEIRKQKLRDQLWPDAAQVVWDYKASPGWLNVPRAMPIIMRILDSQSKGQPVSNCYFELWCRTYNDGFINAVRAGEMAFFSGFDGERAQRTWASRIKRLEELGLIRTAEGASGPVDSILVLNPFPALQQLRDTRKISDRLWNALMSRMVEIGANDLDEKVVEHEVSERIIKRRKRAKQIQA